MPQHDLSPIKTVYSTTRFEQEFYTPLTTKCADVISYITLLHSGDVHQVTSLFTSLSKKLVDRIGSYIYHVRYTLPPYFQKLAEKEDSGHDCRSCSGTCKMQHNEQIIFLRMAHSEILGILGELKQISITHEEHTKDIKFEMLYRLIISIDQMVANLFLLDDTLILPKILEAQNHIHAHR